MIPQKPNVIPEELQRLDAIANQKIEVQRFVALEVLRYTWLVVLCCFFSSMRTAILAEELRSSSPAASTWCAEDGELVVSFCSLESGQLGQTLGAKKAQTDALSMDCKTLSMHQIRA